MRDRCNSARRTIPRAQWKFNAAGTHVQMAAGFDPGKFYEVVYTSKNPPMVGLGPAAARILMRALRRSRR